MTPALALLMLAVPAQADDPPLVGQPSWFSGAVGDFRIETEAAATRVAVEQPFRFTVRLIANGPVRRPPPRPDLTKDPYFSGSFHIEPSNPAGNQPRADIWEFYYTLKAKTTSVDEVPALPYGIFNPSSRDYQKKIAEPIALKVTPADVTPPVAPISPLPATLGELAPAGDVLERPSTPFVPGPMMLVALIVLPPLGCLIWFLAWQRLYPDAARQSRQRRSRAAQVALQALRDIDGRDGERAARAAAVVAGYLHQRFDLHSLAPGPDEVAEFLDRYPAAPELRARLVEFFRTCDALRFAPSPPVPSTDLVTVATDLILGVEVEPWASPPS